uniref:Uncharacterized protein n=1 Tax=Plectus sambesii TaxID=2011161 RepID=A0A914UKS9_9BILA
MDWTRAWSVLLVAVATLTADRASSSDRPAADDALPRPVQVRQCSVRTRTDECRGSMVDWDTFDKCCDVQCVGMRRMYPKPRIYSPVIGASNNSFMFCLCCSDDGVDHEHGDFGLWSTIVLSLLTLLLSIAAWFYPMNDWAMVANPNPASTAM